jgi:hypothetical protein
MKHAEVADKAAGRKQLWRAIGLTALLFGSAPAAQGEPPPAAYREAIQRQRENRFNENEIIAFVYRIYAMYDEHVPVGRYLPLLARHGLEMRFPGETLHSREDFKRWYAGIGNNIASNTHTLDSVRVHVLGGGRYEADIVGLWQAETRKGEYVQFKFRQRWTLADGHGVDPVIQTYVVEEAK